MDVAMEDRTPATAYNMDSPSPQRSSNMTPEPSPTEPSNHHHNSSDHPTSESSKSTTHNPASSQQFCLRWNNHQVINYNKFCKCSAPVVETDFCCTEIPHKGCQSLSYFTLSIHTRVCSSVILTIINWARQPKLLLKLCCRCIPII